jgi:predicted DNA-binding WGR domain protein
MRRFELVEGTSSKFWEVALAECDVTVRFGRIGTSGQTKTKSFGSAAAALKEHDTLVKEKTGKGYAEVGAAPGTRLEAVTSAAAAAAPTAVPAAPPKQKPPLAAAATPAPAPAPSATATAAAATPAPATSSTIAWPDGGFQWTNDLRKALPVVRGIHAPPPADGRLLLAKPITFVDDQHGYHATLLTELAKAAGRTWVLWSAKESAQRIQPQQLQRPDHDFWLELCVQTAVGRVKQDEAEAGVYAYYQSRGLRWAADVGTALHGLSFMIEVGFDLARIAPGDYRFSNIINSLFTPLRQAIAASNDADHAAAIATLERQAAGTPLDRRLRAYLCPHRTDWALASIADGIGDDSLMLKDCVLPVDVALAYLKPVSPYYGYLESSLLLQIHLHGDAAFELLAQTLRKVNDRDGGEKFLALVRRMQLPQMVVLLAELIDRKEVRAALDSLSERFPAAVLKAVIERALASRSRLAEGWAVRLALREPAALAQVLPALDAGDRDRFQGLLQALQSAEAAPERLPPLLREPPWLRKARAVELPTLEVSVPERPEHIGWSAEVKARHAAYQVNAWRARRATNPVEYALTEMQITPAGRARVLAGQPLQADDVKVTKQYFYGESPEVVLLLPDAAGLALWSSYPAKHWYSWGDTSAPINAVLARHGEAALPGLAAYVQAHPEEGLAIALPVDSTRIVPTALHALRNLKKAKVPAIAWLRAHPQTALATALPMAFGKDKTARDDAQFGVRWLVANGFEAPAREAARAHGETMSQALQALLDADPLLVLPSRMPKLPNFFVAPAFRRPVLRDGGDALPTSAMDHIGSMLAISRLEAPYAGLAIVKEVCTPASLAEFAWDLFEAWVAGGAPSKEGWAFTALGLLGDDETARRLAPRIREWPGEAQHQRAVTGLELLATIGSDVALMHLNGIAGKVKFKALQDRAKEKIAAVAEARGFTAAELADRLVPDLGLDEQGTLALDFGPRQFYVGFDETLKPFVKDAQGARLKDLPKPLKSDDAALAEAATERFKQMKKDAKAVASLQVIRLEMSMVERRRWSATDFRLFFLEHPLMRHLAARVVWGVYDKDGHIGSGFRVAEDWTLADADDAQTVLADDADVGIAHVLEMPATMQAAFGQVFADYEILQPFKQLGRETYTLTAQELKSSEITRFENKTVATGSVMGLINRGWERGQAQDAGWVGWFSKPVGDGLEINLELDPGTVVGDLSFEPKQRIPKILLRQVGTWDAAGHVNFERLDPVIASEVLRDAELLAPFKETPP